METNYTAEYISRLASYCYTENDLTAPITSGSFHCDGMLIVPCSMKTLAGISSGYADTLLLRAADVMIKEKRRLLLAVRETPLSPIHLENMLKLAQIGVIIFPPLPAFYIKQDSIGDLVRHSVGRMLDQFGIHVEGFVRWGES